VDGVGGEDGRGKVKAVAEEFEEKDRGRAGEIERSLRRCDISWGGSFEHSRRTCHLLSATLGLRSAA